MAKKRVFTSFDYDHDADLPRLLKGQSLNSDSPFEFVDMSVKEAIASGWQSKVRTRIKGCNYVIVICGQHTHTAQGVAIELQIAQEEGIPYFLLWGRSGKNCTKPTSAKSSDKIYKWTWDNLKALIGGSR